MATWLDPSFDLAWQQLSVFRWFEEPRPPDFRDFKFQTKSGPLQMTSRGWVEAGQRLNLRYTRLQGTALDIATLICYPTNRPDLLPIFAYEWVVIGGVGHAMICDVEVCGQNSTLEGLVQKVYRQTGRDFAKEFDGKEMPLWFSEIAQPHAQFFTAPVDQLEAVFRLQSTYLKLAVENFYVPIVTDGVVGGEDHKDVRRYKHHHADNSPGTKMLQKCFGEAKAREFLYEHHFGPSNLPAEVSS